MVLDAGEDGRVPAVPSPLMYSWYDEHYLGAAHGLAGIFLVLLQVSQQRKWEITTLSAKNDNIHTYYFPWGQDEMTRSVCE